MTASELQEELTRLYTSNANRIAEGTGKTINESRPRAFEDFKRLGIPTKKNENYRYTDLMNYLQGDYSYEIAPSKYSVKLTVRSNHCRRALS